MNLLTRFKGDRFLRDDVDWRRANCLVIPGERPNDFVAHTWYPYGASVHFRHENAFAPGCQQYEWHVWRGAGFDMRTAGLAAGAEAVTFTNQSTVVIAGTTNVVTFGGTSTAPADTNNIATWISVMVTGDTNAYRLPLYK